MIGLISQGQNSQKIKGGLKVSVVNKKAKTQNTINYNPLNIKKELRHILQLSINKKINGILELFDLKNKDDIELSYNDSVFDVVISIPKENDINKISILGVKILETSNFREINKLRGILWNRNDIPISLFITPTDIILNNNFSVQDTQKYLNSLSSNGKFDFELLRYDNLINGKYIKACEKFIKISDRVDQKLLKNIKYALKLLCNKGTSFSKAHNIMSKSIFIKYLEDRKIITENSFEKFNVKNFNEILESNHIEDFFKYMEEKFKGNIFYINEDDALHKYEIRIILDFLSGMDLETKQLSFCCYDFSIIPIELISNIYELFLQEEDVVAKRNKGAFYTPYFLANAMIENINERILKNDYRILDPSCGSGVFLVSCFKKLVSLCDNYTHDELIKLLKSNIFGVDINKQALKITKLSLYIALLDCFNPKDIESNHIQLPDLSNNLLLSDYFNEELLKDMKFDLIIGNPPWTSISTSDCEKYLEKNYKGIISDSQLCQSFILRTKDFLSEDGLATILISNGVLYNTLAVKFRQSVLNNFSIIEILNLQKLRVGLFQNANYPCSVITYSLKKKQVKLCDYINIEKDFYDIIQNKISFDKTNAQQISIRIMQKYDYIWKILHEGSKLDFELISSVRERSNSLDQYLKHNNFEMSQGCSAGKNENNKFLNLKEVVSDSFSNFKVDYNELPNNKLNKFERLHDVKQYLCKNRILIKRSIRDKHPECAFIQGKVFYNNDFYSIYTNEDNYEKLLFLEGLINSDFYNYYQYHMAPAYNKTSQPEIRMNSIKEFPIPYLKKVQYNKIVDLVKEIHKIIENVSAYDIRNKDKIQMDFFIKNHTIIDMYKNLLNSLNQRIYKLYGLNSRDISIIDFSLNYLLKINNNTSQKDFSFKGYYKTLYSLMRNLVPKKYNIYKTSQDGKFFKILFFEITKNNIKSDITQIINLILKTYEMSSINEIFNKVAFRKNFIGTFKDGFFIIKNMKEINWQKAMAYLDFYKIQQLLLIGGKND